MTAGGIARGLAFYGWLYGSLAFFGLLFALPAILRPDWIRPLAKWWLRRMFAALRLIGGVRCEIRGEVPVGRVVVAAKHQSMLDVFMIVNALPEARFVMKRELTQTPVFGFWARKLGAVPVDRGGGQAALRAMVDRMTAEARDGGQIVIYPQGTRTPPGSGAAYKLGVHALYAATGLPCVPAATNSGVRWPRGVGLRPGLAVVEFLPPIAPGLERAAFMADVETRVEAASAALARLD